MKQFVFILLIGALACMGCSRQSGSSELYGLPGSWMLSNVVYPVGGERKFPVNGRTFCRIFGRDTMYYDCQLISTPTGIVIIPLGYGMFEFVCTSGRDTLYFEDNHLYPIRRSDDTTLVIQRNGVVYTYHRNQGMTDKRIQEIKEIVKGDTIDGNGELMRYVLSTSERQLQDSNNRLAYLVGILLLAVLSIVLYLRRIVLRKHEVERQLVQIRKEQANRPPVVAHAFKQAEDDLFRSDYFVSLRRRVAVSGMLREEEWAELERRMHAVWPDMFRCLSGFHRLSMVEWHVCLLVKLRFSPSEMAGVLCKDISTISSIRARLCRKVFGRNGGAKEWDDFILSL